MIGLGLRYSFLLVIFLFVLFCFYFPIPRARSPFSVPFLVTSHHERVQRPLTFGFSWETASRRLQFAVTHLQFHDAGISNFSKTFIAQCRHVVFRQVKVLTFITQKTRIIQLFELKNPTSTSDKESYFVPLNVTLYNFYLPEKPCRKLLTAGRPFCRSNVNCKRGRKTVVTQHSQVCRLRFSMKT